MGSLVKAIELPSGLFPEKACCTRTLDSVILPKVAFTFTDFFKLSVIMHLSSSYEAVGSHDIGFYFPSLITSAAFALAVYLP